MTGEHAHQVGQLVVAVDGTRGVRGRAEDDGLGARREGGLELVARHLEALVDASVERHVDALGELDHLEVADPCRRGDDDLVALVDDGEDDVADLLLGTVADHDLLGCEVQAVLTLQLLADGLAQRHVARHGRVEREVLVDGLLGGLLDVGGGVEVRFADAHVDDVEALGLEFLTLLRHGQRGRWGESRQTCR